MLHTCTYRCASLAFVWLKCLCLKRMGVCIYIYARCAACEFDFLCLLLQYTCTTLICKHLYKNGGRRGRVHVQLDLRVGYDGSKAKFPRSWIITILLEHGEHGRRAHEPYAEQITRNRKLGSYRVHLQQRSFDCMSLIQKSRNHN